MDSKLHEVVISGVSGIFPECDSLDEFETKLMGMENLITLDDRKWVPGELDVPAATGKFKTLVSLDDMFFGVNKKLFEIMDPITILCLKHSFEAVFDAGINPQDISGTDTAVVMSSVTSETEYECVINNRYLGHALIGQSRTMQANRISYFLNTKGPSLVIDASWSCGLQALQEAYILISRGIVNSALVGACNILFGPEVSFHYKAMGKLNEDGKTKSFSADADGYTRSEGCVVLFLQRAEDAHRSYGTVLNVLSKNFGERLTTYSEFSSENYQQLLRECYEQAKVDPSEVAFIEADGCASKKVDAIELNSIKEVMCKNRKTSLAIGCVKSNVGHTEAASALVSVAKALIALKSGMIPPNMNYSSPNPDVSALISGQLKIVTEPTPLNGNIVGVSSIGISGTIGHVVIKQNPKLKEKKMQLIQKSSDNFPWLFIISGREMVSMKNAIEKVITMPFDKEFIALTHSIFKSDIKRHSFRGYAILNTSVAQNHEIKQYDGAEKRSIWYLFSGMGSQWKKMGTDLMRLPTFAKAIHLSHNVLLPKGVNLLEILNSNDPEVFDSILHAFVGIAAIQIGLVDVLKELGVEPDGLIGHSVGELGCAYADGCFTAEQMILSAWARGRASIEAKLIKGMMAAVGMGYQQIKDDLPPSIEVACHNSDNNCTLSGPAEDMEVYIASLKQRGIFAKLVNAANIAYHSKFIKPAAPALLKYLKEVIPDPKPRSKRWVSSSIPESNWDSELARFSSAEYHTNNLLSSVLFEEASAHIPERAIIIEIAPHGLLQSIVKKSLPNCTNIPLINRFEKDTLKHLFQAIGKMYLEGINVNIGSLYPRCEYPVARDVPSLSQLITWDNVKADMITSFMMSRSSVSANPSWAHIKLSDERLNNYLENKIHGIEIIPPSPILWLVMEIFNNVNQDTSGPIVLENVHIQTHQITSDISNSELYILITKGLGDFEVNIDSTNIANGRIRFLSYGENINFEEKGQLVNNPKVELTNYDIYQFFKECSIEFKDSFKLIENIAFNETDLHGTIIWKGEWVEFLDALLMVLSLFHTVNSNQLKLVNSFRYLCLDASYFEGYNFKEVQVFYNTSTNVLMCEGLQVHLPQAAVSNLNATVPDLIRETCEFLSYEGCGNVNINQLEDSIEMLIHNVINYEAKPNKLIIVQSEGDSVLNKTVTTILKGYNLANQVEFIPPTEDTINDLYLNLENTYNILIIGNNSIKRTFKCFKKVRAGFLLLKDCEFVENVKNLYPLLKIKFSNEFHTLYKVSHEEKEKIIINADNKDWEITLKKSIDNLITEKSNALKSIYLLKYLKSLSGIYKFVKYCLSFKNSYLIRFILLDDESPPFSVDNPFYLNHLRKDLVFNICRQNSWGCLKLKTSLVQSKIYRTDEVYQQYYPLSHIKSKNIELKALGLNLLDDAPETLELGALDYCGKDKNGDILFGVGQLNDNKQLIEDKLLCWKKPNNWSCEDAVSVPFFYSIAYYIMKVKKSLLKKNRLLVHRGNLLISQAIINVALALKCEIYTTYDSEEDRQRIKLQFPTINDGNMFPCRSGVFDTALIVRKLAENEKCKMDIIVNTSDDIAILTASIKCLEHSGIMFQLNTQTLQAPHCLGMGYFIEELTFVGLSGDNLIDFSTSIKESIKKEMDYGLENGHIKPLATEYIPITTLNKSAVEMLKHRHNRSVKLVTKIEDPYADKVRNRTFICSANKSYIIFGYEDIHWFDLLSWLVTRGAQEIHIIIDERNLIRSAAHRLESILNNHPSIRVHLHVKNQADNKNEVKNWLENVNTRNEISEIFFIGQNFDQDARNVDSVLRELNYKCGIICIGNGGENTCELRAFNGLPALSISCRSELIRTSIYLPQVEHFINKKIDNPVIFLKEEFNGVDIGKEKSIDPRERLPEDITELLALSNKSTAKACFFEEISSCPKLRHNKDLSPIFLIPSLRPNEMKKLTSKLFYPTFEARLPSGFSDVEETAKELYQDLKKFNFNIFTIITNDWGGALGLSLAKHLEADGKTVLLIMLDSVPQSVQSWVSSVLQMEINLINKYVKIPYKIKKQLPSLSNWDEKLSFALQNAMLEERLKEAVGQGLNILRNCLISVMKYKPSCKKFQGKYFVFCNQDTDIESSIREYCQNKPDIIEKFESSLQTMLNSAEIARTINGLIPYEHKTAARDLGNASFGLNVLTDCRFRTGGLERA